MNSPENPTKSQWKSIVNITSIGLLVVSLGLAIVNGFTYLGIYKFNVQTIDNYKIRNRPFVKLTPINIVNKGKDFNLYGDGKKKETKFHFRLKVKNFGQFPAFIEETSVSIKNILDDSSDLVIWDANETYAVKNFVLFQNEEMSFKRQVLLGDAHIEKIKNKETVYFVFSIKYNTLGVTKGLQDGPFFYWAKYKCYDFIPDKEEFKFQFLIEACGNTEINPTSDLPQGAIDNNESKKRLLLKSGDAMETQTVIISPPSPISP